MINVTREAQKQVKEYFKNKDIEPVRIFITSSCCGQQLAMALDQTKENDSVFTHDGVDYVMETSLLEQAGPVEIDFKGTGFTINSRLELQNSCSSCGTTGSCCS